MNKRGQSPKEAARKMKISATLLWAVIQGRSELTLDLYVTFCAFIGCSLYKHITIEKRIFQADEEVNDEVEVYDPNKELYSNKRKAS